MANSATNPDAQYVQRYAAHAALALGLVIALAANLTYAIPRGSVVVGLGLVAPLVLPVVLYLRTTFTVDGFWHRALRELATLAVAGPAAAVSYVHTYELVLGAGEPWLLAVLAPLSSDGLAGMATLALHRLRQVAGPAEKTKPAQRTPSKPRAPRPPAPEPAEPPVVADESPVEEPGRFDPASIEEIMRAEGCSRRTAYRRLKERREQVA